MQDLARSTAVAQRAWSTARQTADFECFRPHLERIVELKRAEAQLRGLRPRAVRRADRGLRARHHQRDRGPPVRRAAARAGAARGAASPTPPGDRTPACSAAPCRWTGQFDFWRAGRGADRLRLQPRAPGSRRPSLLHQPGPRRLPDRAAIRPARLRRRRAHRAPRGGTRALRAGARSGALRHADGRGGIGRHGRGAGPAVGEPGGPEPRVLGALSAGGPAAFSRTRWATWGWTSSTSRQPGESLADPGPRGRGHLQRARHDPLRAGARAGVG